MHVRLVGGALRNRILRCGGSTRRRLALRVGGLNHLYMLLSRSSPSSHARSPAREAQRGSDGPGLCSSFEGVNRKGIPCPAFILGAPRRAGIDHFPAVCLCGTARCRSSVTGWKDLPTARKADYGELVAPYLHTMDDEIHWAPQDAREHRRSAGEPLHAAAHLTQSGGQRDEAMPLSDKPGGSLAKVEASVNVSPPARRNVARQHDARAVGAPPHASVMGICTRASRILSSDIQPAPLAMRRRV